jgi:hypothetical protein
MPFYATHDDPKLVLTSMWVEGFQLARTFHRGLRSSPAGKDGLAPDLTIVSRFSCPEALMLGRHLNLA